MATAPKNKVSPTEFARGATFGNPALDHGMLFKEQGSSGLRQYSGWVREEFLTQLVGRRGATVYREMSDNSSIIGGLVFAITQAIRKVDWDVVPASDKQGDKNEQEFVESLMGDMSHPWDDFNQERLSMLVYGFAPHEIIYKRRNGLKPEGGDVASSNFDDGRIGIRKLPIRGQDTILKWYFDGDGGVQGLQQQPYIGPIVDIPIQKLLLYRPSSHKQNPEGRSILRTAYRSYYFQKRMEEQEAILLERMSGLPVMSVPATLLNLAAQGDVQALATVAAYQRVVTNVRIDEQMGLLIPSDTFTDEDGKPSAIRQYSFSLETPKAGKGVIDSNITIGRYKTDQLMSVMADFLMLGHVERGTNNLGVTKVDMFYQAIEGWVTTLAEVDNRYLLPRIWKLNGLPPETMPHIKPRMPTRLDLDSLSAYITALAGAGVSLFPDMDTENFLREAGGLPTIDDEKEYDGIVAANKPPPPVVPLATGVPSGGAAATAGNKPAGAKPAAASKVPAKGKKK